MKRLKMKNMRALAILPFMAAASLTAAGCVPKSQGPVPPPMSQRAPAAAPMPPITAAPQNWIDAPATPGDWGYRSTPGGSQALFGGKTHPLFILECSRAASRINLMWVEEFEGQVPMRILTETQDRVLPATTDGEDFPSLVAQLSARDPLLDAMAISRGRFAVEVDGVTLYLPSWPEVSRVIEDCR